MDLFKISSLRKTAFVSCLLTFSSFSFAETYAYRNSDVYYRDDNSPAFVTVYTSPVQAYQAVYAWREHLNIGGSPGNYGYPSGGEIVGYTDANGVWSHTSSAFNLPQDFCGEYKDEQYAVGSPSATRTTKNTFYIVKKLPLDFGPFNPSCNEESWGF